MNRVHEQCPKNSGTILSLKTGSKLGQVHSAPIWPNRSCRSAVPRAPVQRARAARPSAKPAPRVLCRGPARLCRDPVSRHSSAASVTIHFNVLRHSSSTLFSVIQNLQYNLSLLAASVYCKTLCSAASPLYITIHFKSCNTIWVVAQIIFCTKFFFSFFFLLPTTGKYQKYISYFFFPIIFK